MGLHWVCLMSWYFDILFQGQDYVFESSVKQNKRMLIYCVMLILFLLKNYVMQNFMIR